MSNIEQQIKHHEDELSAAMESSDINTKLRALSNFFEFFGSIIR